MRGGPVTNATLFLRFFIFTLINAQLNGAELPATFLFDGLNRTDTAGRVKLTHGDVAVWGGSLEALELSFHFLFFHPCAPSIPYQPALFTCSACGRPTSKSRPVPDTALDPMA